MRNNFVRLSAILVGFGVLLLTSCGDGNTEEPVLQAPALTEAAEITSTSFSVDWDLWKERMPIR